MGKSIKQLFEIDLLDTLAGKTVKTGTAEGRFPKEALKKFSKGLLNIDLSEMRTPKHSRYVFLFSKKRGN